MDNNQTNNLVIYLNPLKKYRFFILLFCLSAVVSSLSLTYFLSEKYIAALTILYRPTESSLLRLKNREAFGAPVPTPPFKIIYQTLRDALKNDVVLKPIVKHFQLDVSIEREINNWYKRLFNKTKVFIKKQLINFLMILKYGRTINEDPTVSAIVKLRKNIDVIATKDSYIYILMVKDNYPQRAAEIADFAGATLVKWLNDEEKKSSIIRIEHLQQQLKEIENKIESLQENRRLLLEEFGIVSLEEDRKKAITNLYEIELEETRVKAEIKNKSKQIYEYTQAIENKSKGFLPSDDLSQMRTRKLFEEIELKGLIERHLYLQSAIKNLENNLSRLPFLEKNLKLLEMEIESIKSEYNTLKEFYTEISSQISSDQSEVNVMHSAAIPSKPSQPIKIYHVGLSIFLALFISSGIVYILDYLTTDSQVFIKEHKPLSISLDNKINSENFRNSPQITYIFREIARILQAKGGNLSFIGKNGLYRIHSLDYGHAPEFIPFPLKKDSVFDKAISSGNTIIINDINETNDLQSSSWNGYSNGSLIVYPLKSNSGEMIGVMSLHNKINPPFTESDVELGAEVINQATRNFSSEITPRFSTSNKNGDAGKLNIMQFETECCSNNIFFRSKIWYPCVVSLGLGISLLATYALRKLGF